MSIISLTYSLNYPFYGSFGIHSAAGAAKGIDYSSPPLSLSLACSLALWRAVLRATDNAIHVSIEVSVFIPGPARICPSINERALINASPIGRRYELVRI